MALKTTQKRRLEKKKMRENEGMESAARKGGSNGWKETIWVEKDFSSSRT